MAKRGRKPKQWLPDELINEFNTADTETVKTLVMESLNKIAKIQETKKQDAELNQLRSDVADINAGYRDAVKYEQAKINFLRENLKERGKL